VTSPGRVFHTSAPATGNVRPSTDERTVTFPAAQHYQTPQRHVCIHDLSGIVDYTFKQLFFGAPCTITLSSSARFWFSVLSWSQTFNWDSNSCCSLVRRNWSASMSFWWRTCASYTNNTASIYPHMPTGNVWIYRLLFGFLFVRLRMSPARIKLAASNFARRFIGVQCMKSPILGNFAPRSPKIGRIGRATFYL